MDKRQDNASYILIVIIAAIILASMLGCTKPEYCYHCTSPIMRDVYYIVDSPDDMQERIDWRIEHLNDTLICNLEP